MTSGQCVIAPGYVLYKKNVKENISPTTGHRPDIQPPVRKHEALWFPSLVALVGRTKAYGGSEFLWRSHRRLTTKPIRSETNKHNGCQMPTMILSGTQGPSLFRIVREGLGSTRRLGAEGTLCLRNQLRLTLESARLKNPTDHRQKSIPGMDAYISQRRSSCLLFQMFGVEAHSLLSSKSLT